MLGQRVSENQGYFLGDRRKKDSNMLGSTLGSP